MPTPRYALVSADATPYYHLINRCVRRAFLCGADRASGKSFDHRKAWLVDRMRELTAIFAIDVCGYAVMSNHFHLVVRVCRDRALSWSDQEVKERYGRLFPRRLEELQTFSELQRHKAVCRWRHRLWDLSWFMRCLNESIARRANKEDGCTGRFWEGRFRSQALLDEGALLTCMAYVDLNPIRAGMADSLEASEFTSIRERLREPARRNIGKRESTTPGKSTSKAHPKQPIPPLAPFLPEETLQASGKHFTTPDRGQDCLPFKFSDYLELLEVIGKLHRTHTDGELTALPARVHARLSLLGLNAEHFVHSVRNFARSFFTMVGSVQRIDTESQRRKFRRRPGVTAAKLLYRSCG